MNERVIYAIALVDHLWKTFTLSLYISGASETENKIKNRKENNNECNCVKLLT
jgi:hypothetical protein